VRVRSNGFHVYPEGPRISTARSGEVIHIRLADNFATSMEDSAPSRRCRESGRTTASPSIRMSSVCRQLPASP
jgi:hypothetical protein